MRNSVYDSVKAKASVDPQSLTGVTAATGASVDTAGFTDAMLHVYGAAASGTPTTAVVTGKLQESADGSTNWTDALDNTSAVISVSLNCQAGAADGVARIEGLGLNRKRYLRVVTTPAFTGGSTPAIVALGEIILGGPAQALPTNTAASNT
jgi:hypothetical protein